MLSELFVTIAQMTLFGSLALLAVSLLLLVLDWLKAPKYLSSLMCLVVAVRLLCPVGIPLPVGFFRLSPVESAVDMVQRTPDSPVGDYQVHLQGSPVFDQAVEAGIVPREDNIINTPVVLTKPDSLDPAERASEKQIPILLWIWLAGCLGMMGYGAVTYWMLKRKVATAVKCPQLGENVYCSDQIPGPFVCGVIRPKIYLPLAIREEETGYILLHEQTHIRRRDHLVKLLYYLALCVHWFNPLVWSFQKIAAAQMEFACDEAVLKKMGTRIRADYSRSILNMAVGRKITGSPLAFGENSPRERIQNVLKYKKPALVVIGIAAILCIAVAAVCMASPQRTEPTEESVVHSYLQAEVDKETDGIVSARILTDCPEGEAGTQVYIRLNDGTTGAQPESIQPGDWLNVGYQVIEHDPKGGPETYVALDTVTMNEYLSSFTLYSQAGEVLKHNVLYNSWVSMQLPGLLLNSYGEEESTAPYPGAEEFLRVEIGEGGHRAYFIYGEDGKFYVEHPMDYRSQISQETYDALMAYLDKKELPNRSGETPPGPAKLESRITLQDTKALVEKARGGEPLDWADFESYTRGRDVGSGLYIVPYPVKDSANLTVLVGAMSPGGPVEYAYLISAFGEEEHRVDLTKCTYQEWEEFVTAYGEPPTPEEVPDHGETMEPPSSSQAVQPAPTPSQTPAAPAEPLTYLGAEVLEAYSYNPTGYTYHKIAGQKQLETALNLLESGKTAAPKGKSEGGFLLVTSTGREEIYIDSQEKELLTLCRNNNAAQPGLVKWLVFMSPEKITGLEFYSGMGPDSWQFKTDEHWALQEASSLLKSLTVSSQNVRTAEVNWGNPDTGGGTLLFLRFNTGVYYKLQIYEEGVKIISKDMSYSIDYSWAEENYNQVVTGMKRIYDQDPTGILELPGELKLEDIVSVYASGSLGDSSFHIDTSDGKKISRLWDILHTMRVYGTGKTEDAGSIGFNTPAGRNFDIRITNRDGSEYFFAYTDGLLYFGDDRFVTYGFRFTEEDFTIFYNTLSGAAQ